MSLISPKWGNGVSQGKSPSLDCIWIDSRSEWWTRGGVGPCLFEEELERDDDFDDSFLLDFLPDFNVERTDFVTDPVTEDDGLFGDAAARSLDDMV